MTISHEAKIIDLTDGECLTDAEICKTFARIEALIEAIEEAMQERRKSHP